MKYFHSIAIAFILLSGFSFSVISQEDAEITVVELEQHIGYLASDELMGRLPGTEYDSLAAAYILNEFNKAGLIPLANHGLQYFDVVTGVKAGKNNYLKTDNMEAIAGQDFTPISFSKNGQLTAEVAFVGYGFQIENDTLKWDDYSGIDVNGKWVIIMLGQPGEESSGNVFSSYVGLREKVLAAKDNGAAGVLFVSGPDYDEEDAMMRMFYDKTTSDAGVPVFHIKRHIADALIAPSIFTIAALEDKIVEGNTPFSFQTTIILDGSSDVIHQKVRTMNVVGMIEGSDPELKNEFIVIGAHYDHLGMGGPGSGSREPDTHMVHNGADDNASGVAGIIEVSESLVSSDIAPRRSVIVVAFSAEEMGLIGSKYFVENPLMDMEKVVAMFNFDMIGRLSDENSIAIGGTGTSLETEDLLNKYLDEYEMKGSFSSEGFGPSDHAAFYAEDIPVFFISTGAHGDYHTPQDDAELINYEGEKQVLDLSYALIMDVANRDDALTYQEAGAKNRSTRMNFKVTLGIVPDFTSTEDAGLGVGGVRVDGPADKAGMKKGDVIVALDGLEVGNIYDYMARLKKLEAGQIISVDVMRDGERIVLLVQL